MKKEKWIQYFLHRHLYMLKKKFQIQYSLNIRIYKVKIYYIPTLSFVEHLCLWWLRQVSILKIVKRFKVTLWFFPLHSNKRNLNLHRGAGDFIKTIYIVCNIWNINIMIFLVTMKMPELLYNHILSRNIELKYKTLFYVKGGTAE